MKRCILRSIQMAFHTAAWFLLIGLIGFFVVVDPKNIFGRNEAETYSMLADDIKRAKEIENVKVARIAALVVFAVLLTVVWQGFYLIKSGYLELSLSGANSEALGIAASKRRGGMFVLMVFKYLPFFFIGGYGYLAFEIIKRVKAYHNKQKWLEDLAKRLKSMTAEEKQQWKEGMLAKAEAEKKEDNKRKQAQENLLKQTKEALNKEPPFLEDLTQEGWLIDLDRGRIKRFYSAPNKANNPDFITEETGQLRANQPPVITKKLLLTKREAKSDWKYYLENGYSTTTPKWR